MILVYLLTPQCITEAYLLDHQLFTNVSVYSPHLLDAPTMLVGADVTHPSPDQTNIPSVAAVSYHTH